MQPLKSDRVAAAIKVYLAEISADQLDKAQKTKIKNKIEELRSNEQRQAETVDAAKQRLDEVAGRVALSEASNDDLAVAQQAVESAKKALGQTQQMVEALDKQIVKMDATVDPSKPPRLVVAKAAFADAVYEACKASLSEVIPVFRLAYAAKHLAGGRMQVPYSDMSARECAYNLGFTAPTGAELDALCEKIGAMIK